MNPDNLPDLTPLPVWKDYIDAVYLRLMSDFRSGKINNEQLQGTFSLLVFVDRGRNLWSIGQQTGRWYIRKDEEWQLGEPPQMLYTFTTEEGLKQLMAKTEKETMPAPMDLQEPHIAAGSTITELICPQCGRSNPADRHYCTNCGAELSRAAKAEITPEQQAQTLAKVTCKVCGAENMPEKKYCTQCGSRLEVLAGGNL